MGDCRRTAKKAALLVFQSAISNPQSPIGNRQSTIGNQCARVMAPSDADETSAAYLANTPVL
jgi:hypothetical protein